MTLSDCSTIIGSCMEITAESRCARMSHITLDKKHTGKPSAGNLHAGFDEAVAAMLVGVLAGRPARENCPVVSVVISGGGAGDQTVESPEVQVPVGWVEAWSAPTRGRASRQVVAKVNRRSAPK